MSTSANMIAHTTAATATAASVGGLVLNIIPPALAALASLGAFIWYAIQVYESKTVQRWLKRRQV